MGVILAGVIVAEPAININYLLTQKVLFGFQGTFWAVNCKIVQGDVINYSTILYITI